MKLVFCRFVQSIFLKNFWNVMEDIVLNRKPLENVILQRKTKQNKKERDEKKKAKLICCGNSTPGWTYGKFLSLSNQSVA